MPIFARAYDGASRIGGATLNLSCAVAALVLLFGVCLTGANADDAAASSGPSCEVGDPLNTVGLSPEQMVLSGAIFMKLCREIAGAIVNGNDSRQANTLKMPTQPSRSPTDFYPHDEVENRHSGIVIIATVVEADARISWAAVLKSCGYPALDGAAVRWARSTSFRSPAYLGSKPVRVYMLLRVDFRTG